MKVEVLRTLCALSYKVCWSESHPCELESQGPPVPVRLVRMFQWFITNKCHRSEAFQEQILRIKSELAAVCHILQKANSFHLQEKPDCSLKYYISGLLLLRVILVTQSASWKHWGPPAANLKCEQSAVPGVCSVSPAELFLLQSFIYFCAPNYLYKCNWLARHSWLSVHTEWIIDPSHGSLMWRDIQTNWVQKAALHS